MLSNPPYLYDRKVPVLFVFKGGLCVVDWMLSVTSLNCTGAEASLMALMSVDLVGAILLSVNSVGAILLSVELAKGEAMGLASVVSTLLNGVAAIVLWEPTSLNGVGCNVELVSTLLKVVGCAADELV